MWKGEGYEPVKWASAGLERGAQLALACATLPQMAYMQIVNGLRAEGSWLTGGRSRLFMTHPPVAERVERLRALDRERAVWRPAVAALYLVNSRFPHPCWGCPGKAEAA